MAKQIIILGTGGNCIDILDTILDINDARGQPVYQCIGFLDDNREKWGQSIHGVPVSGPLESALEYEDCYFVNGIGSTANFWKRAAILARTQIPPERFETLVHPTASVSRMAQLGQGTVIFQHVTVTSNVTIGDHVLVLPNTVISHDDVIGSYTCIAGGVSISGGVHIGHSCYLGSRSCFREYVRVGSECLVGMGSVVLSDVADNSVVVGSPARLLRNTR